MKSGMISRNYTSVWISLGLALGVDSCNVASGVSGRRSAGANKHKDPRDGNCAAGMLAGWAPTHRTEYAPSSAQVPRTLLAMS